MPEEDRGAIQAITDKARTQRTALKAAISTWSGNAVSCFNDFINMTQHRKLNCLLYKLLLGIDIAVLLDRLPDDIDGDDSIDPPLPADAPAEL